MIEVVQIPCLADNYGFLVHDPASTQTISVDSPDADAITRELEARNWSLDAVWNTHHHYDHTGGNAALKARWKCQIVAPKAESTHIAEADRWIQEGEWLTLGDVVVDIIATPGHTMGHLIYLFGSQRKAFVGDALFALGCGRMFEGKASDMWPALQKIMKLPPATQIYCAHEYTAANLTFAKTIDPDNQKLLQRGQQIEALRAKNQPTVPFLLETDMATNPFLRAFDANIRNLLNMKDASDEQVFAEIRRRKDIF